MKPNQQRLKTTTHADDLGEKIAALSEGPQLQLPKDINCCNPGHSVCTVSATGVASTNVATITSVLIPQNFTGRFVNLLN